MNLKSIRIRIVPVQLGDGRKVVLRILEWILGYHQRFFLEKYAPIKFRLEKAKEENVCVSWLIIYDTIILKLDWSTSLFDYVKVPKIGKSSEKMRKGKTVLGRNKTGIVMRIPDISINGKHQNMSDIA